MEQTEKVATTVMTDVRMLILLVMTTILVPPESVLGGEVSVSRHFKGDIFSQQGNNYKILASLLVATENTPYLVLQSWTVDKKEKIQNTEAEALNFSIFDQHSLAHLIQLQSDLFSNCTIRFVLMNLQFFFAN